MRNLTNGLGFTFAFSIVKSGFVWPIQNQLQKQIDKQSLVSIPSWLQPVVSGAIGNVIPGILCNPANLIKVRYMETSVQPQSAFKIVRGIIKNEGIGAFRRGLFTTLLRDFVWGMLYFPLFFRINNSLASSPYFRASNDKEMGRLKLQQFLLASSLSASLSTLGSSVLDGIRLYEMKKPTTTTKNGLTFLQGMKHVLKPTKQNILSTAIGVTRVSITTTLGHLTFHTYFNYVALKSSSSSSSSSS